VTPPLVRDVEAVVPAALLERLRRSLPARSGAFPG